MQHEAMSGEQQETIVVAVEDPVLHPEAMHVAAATGRPVIEVTAHAEVARASRSASAVLVDAATAAVFAQLPRRDRVFFLSPDPGPIDWRSAMECHAENAFLLPAQAPELLAVLGRRTQARGSARTIGLVGACGGAGTSVLAVAVAQTSPNHAVLIDAAPCSGGMDLLLGIEETPGARWQDVNFGEGFVGAKDLWEALPHTKTGIGVLTNARTTLAEDCVLDVPAAVECAQTGDGLVVVDAPQSAVDVLGLCDVAVVVIPAEVRAVAAATALVARLKAMRVRVVGVLRHRGWSGMTAEDVERVAAVPVLGEVPQVPRLAKTVEMQGLRAMPRALAKVAAAIVEERGSVRHV